MEIGPGTGILTDIIFQSSSLPFFAFEVDKESILFLHEKYPAQKSKILEQDFLTADLNSFELPWNIIGNFPYNISSQIFFKIYENHTSVEQVVGMVQREVGERIVSPPGSKAYGILSVLLQAFFHIEYLFTVPPEVFKPPPKVQSAVIRLKRNDSKVLDCDEKLFKRVVKEAFGKRRKTLRNALKGLNLPSNLTEGEPFQQRAEQLSVADFVSLTNMIAKAWKQ